MSVLSIKYALICERGDSSPDIRAVLDEKRVKQILAHRLAVPEDEVQAALDALRDEVKSLLRRS